LQLLPDRTLKLRAACKLDPDLPFNRLAGEVAAQLLLQLREKSRLPARRRAGRERSQHILHAAAAQKVDAAHCAGRTGHQDIAGFPVQCKIV